MVLKNGSQTAAQKEVLEFCPLNKSSEQPRKDSSGNSHVCSRISNHDLILSVGNNNLTATQTSISDDLTRVSKMCSTVSRIPTKIPLTACSHSLN